MIAGSIDVSGALGRSEESERIQGLEWLGLLYLAKMNGLKIFARVRASNATGPTHVYSACYHRKHINLRRLVIVSFGIINILTDWYILALPLPIVLGLKLEPRTKWSICSLFMIGGLVCIISIVRLVYSRRVGSADPSCKYHVPCPVFE